MRISRDFGMVFLANPKCASNTVERYIHGYMPDVESPAGMIRHAGPIELEHYLRVHHLDLDDYLVFTTIRNPWDRMVSLFAYARARPDSAWHSTAIESPSFSAFLRTETVAEFVERFGLHGFTHTPDGRRMVDVVIGIERFSTDLPVMFRRYGIEFVDTGRRDNPSQRDGYRSYYDDADRRLVEDLFAADIDFGKYEF